MQNTSKHKILHIITKSLPPTTRTNYHKVFKTICKTPPTNVSCTNTTQQNILYNHACTFVTKNIPKEFNSFDKL